jgi:hypothetical protein
VRRLAIIGKSLARVGDPIAAKRKAERSVPTFSEAAQRVHAEHCKAWRNAKHEAQWIKSRLEAMRDLWTGAGLEAVETREISVQRTFSNFEEFWDITVSGAPSLRPTLGAMSRAEVELLKTRVRARLPGDAAGRITYGSRANAVKGRVPA